MGGCVGTISSTDKLLHRERLPELNPYCFGGEVRSAHGMRGLKQQQALMNKTGKTTTANMRRMICCFSRRVSIWPAAPFGSSVML